MAQLRMSFQRHGMAGREGRAAGHLARFSVQPPGSSGANSDYVRISTSGRGRRWQANTAIGAWRDFAELDLDKRCRHREFRRPLRRSGQRPAARPRRRHPGLAHSENCLALFAQAWDPPGSDGISRVTDDKARLLIAAEVAVGCLRTIFLGPDAIIPKIDPDGFELEFQNLGGFLLASAADHLVDRQPMRRCQVCSRWFPIRRTTARFCSAACTARNAREINHGKR